MYIAKNIAVIVMNHALSDSNLAYEERQSSLANAQLWADKAGLDGQHLFDQIETEKRELQIAYDYLIENEELSTFIPGRQLLVNPNFDNGVAGWIEYRSTWESVDMQVPDDPNSVVMFSRSGSGHGSLSQPVNLTTNTCYFFNVSGSAERNDEISTFWLYWERFEEDTRQGQNLISEKNDQIWKQRMGTFCLPSTDKSIEKIVISPVNVYGDVTVYLGKARLYELQSDQ